MADPSVLDKRKNKDFVIQNKFYLKAYGQKNQQFFGNGIIVINLLMLEFDNLDQEDLDKYQAQKEADITLQQALSYIPESNFWFKVLYLKIKKKYQIDIKNKYTTGDRLLVVFIKDVSVEHFSIYTLKTDLS